ncbi:tRNA pseudouridine13 synthase [Trypanosoma rangeli]|uniref:tRNA pseudouridine13 synthase n=1 Tax=Trypanosoma rangeli TaxID=5698 RepID=A0A422NSE9_TRYRA|nr:tRNA pseudouridine13 synthase [Trypanosoma rangeli]RNF08397.1 tRNA pseudouridine13 synthase [Trypanosoma rangeli]|eukprot:RNF08397.1 tRNA pseudouridine13 synthase [Trypanosoma rangeli]
MMTSCLAEKAHKREERVGMRFFLMDAFLAKNGTNVSFKRPLVSLKTLYSDFVVRELSPLYNNGEPLVLESVPVPERLGAKAKAVKRSRRGAEQAGEEAETKNEEGENEGEATATTLDVQQTSLLERVQARFASLLSQEDLASLLDALRTGTDRMTVRASLTKAQRTELHAAVKEVLGATHISRTLDGALVIENSTPATRREEMRRSNPIRLQNFLHFTLYKENMDSNSALRAIATQLGMPLRQLLFSGTKDKRAVTLQRVAVRGLSRERLAEINARSFGPECKVKVCGFQEAETGLRLGDTMGNHFLIALRLLPDSPQLTPDTLKVVQEAVGSIGAVNYYGPQRFGTTEVLTSDVGIKLLSGEFEQALRMLFHSKAIVEPNILPSKEAVERRDFAEALQLLPRYCFQERDILKHLVRCPNDFLGAFHRIPRTLGMLYCHAVQSLIWNLMATERLKLGLEPLPGDLLPKSRYTRIQKHGSRPNDTDTENDLRVLLKEEGLPEVVRLTAEDAGTGLFRLCDVLLTVPGPDEELQYPDVAGCTREAYVATLTLMGAEMLLNTENPLVKVYHYHGAYRPLVVQPKRLKLRLMDAKGPRAPLLPTDLERLSASSVPNGVGNHETEHDDCATTPVSKAIVAEFSLPPGSYATSVLREFSISCSEGYHTPVATEADDSNTLNGGVDAAAS